MLWLLGTIIGSSPANDSPFRNSDARLKAQFDKTPVKLNIRRYQCQERTIRYLETGVDTRPMVLFIHGAPGAADAFLDYLKDSYLSSRARMISVDRPGHGYSDFGNAIISVEQQAAMLSPLLENIRSERKPLLVGHSFGGTVAVRLAMDYPDRVGSLLLCAPAVDPAHEKIWGVSYPADWKILRRIVPPAWRVTNDEKLAHAAELRKMLPFWDRIRVPTTLIHGDRDRLVPLENAYFAQKKLINAPVTLDIRPGLDHLFPWTHPGLIREAILRYLDDSSGLTK